MSLFLSEVPVCEHLPAKPYNTASRKLPSSAIGIAEKCMRASIANALDALGYKDVGEAALVNGKI